jgi:hypothetical protein
VRKRPTWFGIANSVTMLAAAVTTYYGGVFWKASAVVIWSKLLLHLSAAVWATTLLHMFVGSFPCRAVAAPTRSHWTGCKRARCDDHDQSKPGYSATSPT